MLKKKKIEDVENTDAINDAIDTETEEVTGSAIDEKSAEDLLKEEISLANDKYLRLYAEFDNFRRRTTKERVDLLQQAGKEVIVSLIPVIDDFERAVKSMENATDVRAVKEGVILVQNKLNNILGQKGLKPMESIGQPFDADLHEAITNIPAPTDDMKGKVIDEMEKGYYLNDKVIRFAKVIVGA
ncbi:nucleotide exchange factor GrpE [Mucilaginibacter corticis]|uniref:Protein GrpE n=1 Tax=Mucilaginibacter corticis TaxID=2597670 RepID=A0A556MLT4_9SPHI|nr:nucleotide exchange factor GrpE [Mucilaginibacter corticis]TSJ40802.1 nucleotide exchange factor GrpE [Mucilaginibacter corticis]